MTGGLDVAARLADGLPAVRAAQEYLSACESLGYRQPDLSGRPGQVFDWYRSEDGLDLGALADDSAALDRAAARAAEVLELQDRQSAALGAGWRGAGGTAAAELLRRHGAASAAATAALRTAADALTTLRTELWQLVDRKVTATQGIDGGGRTDWQAAAHTVLTGAGDRSVASELVDAEVKPFVDEAIGCEWLTVMNQTLTSIEEKFDAAIAELTGSAAVPDFGAGEGEAPPWAANWGPPWAANWGQPGAASWGSPPVADGAASAIGADPAPAEAAAPGVPPPAVPPTGPGGGLPDPGAGLSTVGRQLVDLLGGLLGPVGEALGNGVGAAGVDPMGGEDAGGEDAGTEERDGASDADTDAEDDDRGDDTPEDDTPDDGDPDAGGSPGEDPQEAPDPEHDPDPAPGEPETHLGADTGAAGEPAPATPPPTAPAPEPVSGALPPPEHEPVTATGTPCEIAAAELPQVGE